jgi:hypothetical protein
MYKTISMHQMTFFDFNQSCGMQLDGENEWIVLSTRIFNTFLAYSGILMNARLRKHRWSHSGKDLDQRLAELIEFCGMLRSKCEMLDYLGLTDSKNFREGYLVPLLNAGKIEMTIPDKPSSRRQKYKKVNSDV